MQISRAMTIWMTAQVDAQRQQEQLRANIMPTSQNLAITPLAAPVKSPTYPVIPLATNWVV
jgi:hypothetical protein